MLFSSFRQSHLPPALFFFLCHYFAHCFLFLPLILSSLLLFFSFLFLDHHLRSVGAGGNYNQNNRSPPPQNGNIGFYSPGPWVLCNDEIVRIMIWFLFYHISTILPDFWFWCLLFRFRYIIISALAHKNIYLYQHSS